jgi:hypothetical protein
VKLHHIEALFREQCHRFFNKKLTVGFWHCRTGAFARHERALFSGYASDGFLMRVSMEALCAGDPAAKRGQHYFSRNNPHPAKPNQTR